LVLTHRLSSQGFVNFSWQLWDLLLSIPVYYDCLTCLFKMLRIKDEVKSVLSSKDNRVKRSNSFKRVRPMTSSTTNNDVYLPMTIIRPRNIRETSEIRPRNVRETSEIRPRNVRESTEMRPRNGRIRGESIDLHGDTSASTMKTYFDQKCDKLREKIELISIKTKKLDQSCSMDQSCSIDQSRSMSTENLTTDDHTGRSATAYQNKYNYRHEVNRRQHEFNTEFINLLNEALAMIDGKPSRPLPLNLKLALTSLEKRENSFRYNE